MSNTTGEPFATTTTPYGPLTQTYPVGQRAGAAQAAVTTTASQTTTPYGYSTSTQADQIVTLVNEIRATLVACNIMKGSA